MLTQTTSNMQFYEVVTSVDAYKLATEYLGRTLLAAKGYYKEMIGEGINTFPDFLAQPEVGLSATDAKHLILLVEWLDATGLRLEELNLATARFCASKGILDPELFEDMKTLSVKDFKERHYEVKKGLELGEDERTYTYLVMKKCNETGNLSRVYVEEELIKDLIPTDNG